MRDHLKFCILLHTPGYHLSLGSTFCSPSQVATDAARGKGTVFPEVALQQTRAHWSEMTLHEHQHCFSSLLSSLPFSGCPMLWWCLPLPHRSFLWAHYWSNFPNLHLFLMIVRRSSIILKLPWQLCVPHLSYKMNSVISGRNLENLPASRAGHRHTDTTAPVSLWKTAGTADLKAEPPCNTGVLITLAKA